MSERESMEKSAADCFFLLQGARMWCSQWQDSVLCKGERERELKVKQAIYLAECCISAWR